MPTTGRNIFDDSRLFVPAKVFFESLTLFSYTEYYTVSPYTLYKASFIYILPIGLYNFLNGRQVKERKPYLYCFSYSSINTNGIHTTGLKGLNVRSPYNSGHRHKAAAGL